MAFSYPPSVLLILVSLIVTGAARSLMVRTLFQMGYEHALLLTLLYLLGQALALPLHWITLMVDNSEEEEELKVLSTSSQQVDPPGAVIPSYMDLLYESDDSDGSDPSFDEELKSQMPWDGRERDDNAPAQPGTEGETVRSPARHHDHKFLDVEKQLSSPSKVSRTAGVSSSQSMTEALPDKRTITYPASPYGAWTQPNKPTNPGKESSSLGLNTGIPDTAGNEEIWAESDYKRKGENVQEGDEPEHTDSPSVTEVLHRVQSLKRKGSFTGLSERSQMASERMLNAVPVWARLVIPSIFNLLHAVFRIVALLYVAASVNEMFISGTELLLSVLMARFIRKREVSRWRWGGVLIVSLGLVIIVVGTLLQPDDPVQSTDDEEGTSASAPEWLGFVLLLAKCLAAGMQDISEEIFMQEGNIPASLLLGIEGCIGLAIGIPMYFGLAGFLGENPMDAFRDLFGSGLILGLAFATVIVFAAAGVFNLVATAVTSSMTRNVWKNFRPLLVWAVGLIIFYASVGVPRDDRVGEAWVEPKSYFLLGGFAVIAGGVGVYYIEPKKASSLAEDPDENKPEPYGRYNPVLYLSSQFVVNDPSMQ